MKALTTSLAMYLIVVGAILAAQSLPTTRIEPAPMALVIRYADGRQAVQLVSAKPASMWTPQCPRVTPPAQTKEDAPKIGALQVSRVLVGDDVEGGHIPPGQRAPPTDRRPLASLALRASLARSKGTTTRCLC